MKKQVLATILFVLCAMFTQTSAIAQGFIIYKNNGESLRLLYAELDSIVTFDVSIDRVNGHECIDLGLSVKWASCNVGATKPEEYGGYYAFGETEEKAKYDWWTYKWCRTGDKKNLSKYTPGDHDGDNKKILDPSDDVATVKWGSSWRMPTGKEIDELLNKCAWKWTTYNGVNGYLVTGTNGNSIFLPAAGYRWSTYLYDDGSEGYYWSATVTSNIYNDAEYLKFDSDECSSPYLWRRSAGHTIRPVTE